MNASWKWLLAAVVLAALLISACLGFLSRGSKSEPVMEAALTSPPARELTVPRREANAVAEVSPPSSVVGSDAGSKIAELTRQVDELRSLANGLAENQKRLEAMMQNLSLSIDGSNLRIHTFEEQQAEIATMSDEVEKRRKQVAVYHAAAVQAAKQAGVSDASVELKPSEIMVLPPGRDYTALVEARAQLLQATEILKTAETELINLRMQKVLRSDGGVR